MANTTTSPNMNMPVPVVGVDPGPDWATNINSCLSIIDAHTHSAGSGVQITPGGININADLPFNQNNLTTARSLRLYANGSPLSTGSDVGCLYRAGVDLYYNDGSGNQIRITQSGGISGTSGSIGGLVSPASATYVSGTPAFVWQSAANTSANLDAGSIVLRNLTANSKGLTLSPPNAMGANYTITLPSLPAAQNFMTLDASGNVGAAWNVDNSTLQVSSNTVQVKANGITRTQLASVGQQISSSCGTFTQVGPSGGYVDVTNLTVTITTTGRPVYISTISDGSLDSAYTASVSGGGASLITSFVQIVRGVTTVAGFAIGMKAGGSTLPFITVPATSIMHLDTPAAGTYTYKIQVSVSSANQQFNVQDMKLMAYEL